MRIRSIKSGNDAFLLQAELQLGLIAVAPRVFHAENRFHAKLLHAGITRERFAHDLLLALQLAGIRDMLNLASAANTKHRARRLNTVRRTLLHFYQLCLNKFRLDLFYLGFDDFIRDRSVNKHCLAAVIADSFAVDPKPFDRNDYNVTGLQLICVLTSR